MALTNTPPEFPQTSLTRSIAENTATNTNIGAVIPAATDDDNDDLEYTMEGTDAASFTFDTSSRQIKTKAGVTYDFETKSSYSVTIKVSDGTASDTVAVTISVTDVDELSGDEFTYGTAVTITTITNTGGNIRMDFNTPLTAAQLRGLFVQFDAGDVRWFSDSTGSTTRRVWENTGISWTANTDVVVDIAANLAPAPHNSAVTTAQDTAHAFTAENFGHVDPENHPLDKVKIVTLPPAT